MNNIIQIEDLSKIYTNDEGHKFEIYDHFNLSIDANYHMICLTGADGSGKSTLLKILSGVLGFNRGKVLLNGLIPNQDDEKFSSLVGYMSQTLGLYEELSVFDNLKILSALRGLSVKDNLPYLDNLLKKTGLLEFKDYKAGELSGGMKQKLALCCTIAPKPHILILDEPTVGVDPLSRMQLWQIILDYLKEENGYCIFSTAYLEESNFCNCTLMIEKGKLLMQGANDKLLEQIDNLCYSLEIKDRPINQCLKEIIEFNQDDDNLIIDICPRLGLIDLLVKPQFKQEEVFKYLACKLKECKLIDNDKQLKLTPRKGILEDLYIYKSYCLKSDHKHHQYDHLLEDNTSHTDVSEDVIVVKDIQKKFGKFTAVQKSSFKVQQGKIFGLLGPNGAGKTTTFRMICALTAPTKGQITINGFNLSKSKHDARGSIGYVSQKFSLYKKLSVEQNLEYFGLCYGLSGSKLKDRIEVLLDEFSLRDLKNENSELLPFGVQRQLSMACALIHQPKILFLDEATSGADPLARRNFWYLINKLTKTGTSVIVTTHFMEEAEYCDEFLIQDKGKILVLGAPNDICMKNGVRISIEEKFIELIQSSRQEG